MPLAARAHQLLRLWMQHEVCGLHVAVHDTGGMHVAEPLEERSEYSSCKRGRACVSLRLLAP
eukprot:scaffold273856_cov36-Tisochrysis_lutea.AAC.1